MTRISIIAATVWGNRGAEAMLEATVGRMRDLVPDARFEVFSYYPDRDRALVTDSSITVHSCTPAHLVFVTFPWTLALGLARALRLPYSSLGPRSIRALAGSDLLIDLAGVSFIDGREKFLPFNVLTIWPAMVLGVPVCKLAQAMGPFRSPFNRIASRILRRCRLVVARGDVTLGHLRDSGFPAERILAAPDVAFLFQPDDRLSDEGEAEAQTIAAAAEAVQAGGGRVVGLCPSAVIAAKAAKSGWDYIGFLASTVGALVGADYTVLLFPNATRASAGEALRNNDLPVIRAVLARLDAQQRRGVLAVEGDMNAAHIRTLVSRCTCVAVSRFHAMVGALAAGVPVLVLGWSHKYLEVMKQFGQEAWVLDETDRDPVRFAGMLVELDARASEATSRIREALPGVVGDSAGQFDAVREIIAKAD